MSPLLGLILLALLVGASSIISMSEIAFAAAREVRIRALAEGGDSRAIRFTALRADAGNIITAFQIAINSISILAGVIGDGLVGPMFADALVLRAARAYEGVRPIPRPNVAALQRT